MTEVHGEFQLLLGDWQALAERARPVRMKVFVEEQGVPPELECDAYDAVSRHAVAVDRHGVAIGTGRLLPDGHIGRMAVLAPWRRQGVGSALLESLMAQARAQGMVELALNAQIDAQGFYRRFGFAPVGDEFMEAGIAHQAMSRTLP